MTQYMILIYGDESAWSKLPPEIAKASFTAFMAYNQELAASGVLRAGGQLQPTSNATTLRTQDGKVVTMDGPFAETREQLGGYYVVEVETLDEALRWAARCPAVQGGAIEVRPLLTVPGETTAR